MTPQFDPVWQNQLFLVENKEAPCLSNLTPRLIATKFGHKWDGMAGKTRYMIDRGDEFHAGIEGAKRLQPLLEDAFRLPPFLDEA